VAQLADPRKTVMASVTLPSLVPVNAPFFGSEVNVRAPAWVSRLSASYWKAIGVPPSTDSEAVRKLLL
jgi:hypothetical protein